MKVTTRLLIRKGKHEGMIQMIIYYNGTQKEFSLKRKIKVREWDSKSKLAIGKHNKTLNMLIRKTRSEIERYIDSCEFNNNLVNLDEVVNSVLGSNSKINVKKDEIKLVDFITEYINTNPDNLRSISLKSYKTLKSHVLVTKPKITLKDVDQAYVVLLEEYLYGIGNKVNSVATKLKKLRKILGLCFRQGLIKEIPFGRDKYQIKVEKHVGRKYWTTEELIKLESYVPITNSESRVMNLVKFNLNVGLRIRDLFLLKKGDFIIKNGAEKGLEIRLNLNTSKTGTIINILMTSQGIKCLLDNDILNKSKEDNIFNWLNVSRLTDEVSIYKEVSSKTTIFNKTLKSICNKVNIPVVSSHSIRHTLATKLLNKDVPISSISTMLGHTSIVTTQIYTKVIQTTLDQHIMKALEDG